MQNIYLLTSVKILSLQIFKKWARMAQNMAKAKEKGRL